MRNNKKSNNPEENEQTCQNKSTSQKAKRIVIRKETRRRTLTFTRDQKKSGSWPTGDRPPLAENHLERSADVQVIFQSAAARLVSRPRTGGATRGARVRDFDTSTLCTRALQPSSQDLDSMAAAGAQQIDKLGRNQHRPAPLAASIPRSMHHEYVMVRTAQAESILPRWPGFQQ